LPRLEREYNPRVVEALVRLGAHCRASEHERRQHLRAPAHFLTIEASPDRIVFERRSLGQVPLYARADMIRLAWRDAGWPEGGMDAESWARIAGLARWRGRVSIAGGVEAVAGFDSLVLMRPSATSAPPEVPEGDCPLSVSGEVAWTGGTVVASLDPDAPRDETLDLDRLALPLFVRAPIPGDRFEPLGMPWGSTPLNDFFRGRGVPRERRRLVPLVCDQTRIVWVVGHRIAHPPRLRATTTNRLALRWEPAAKPGCG
jgi:tRNA(Ile)-lysidine synthase